MLKPKSNSPVQKRGSLAKGAGFNLRKKHPTAWLGPRGRPNRLSPRKSPHTKVCSKMKPASSSLAQEGGPEQICCFLPSSAQEKEGALKKLNSLQSRSLHKEGVLPHPKTCLLKKRIRCNLISPSSPDAQPGTDPKI
ncbi:UNVERIFIED_CONTAM: hypothetical protein Sindi_0035200 [Sesamum indicum]